LRSSDFALSKKEDKKSKEKSEMMWHRGEGGRMTTKRDVTSLNDCLLANLPALV
jgi:hypothetical protein